MPYQKNSPDTNTDWLTPPGIIEALGDFDLDPCTPHDMPWPTARYRYTVTGDWLARQTTNAPLCLIAYGRRNLDALHRCGLGAVVVGDGRKG